jgi:hypothetical protein
VPDSGELGSIRWPVTGRQAGEDALGVVAVDLDNVSSALASYVFGEQRGVLPAELPGQLLPDVREPVVAAGAFTDHGEGLGLVVMVANLAVPSR